MVTLSDFVAAGNNMDHPWDDTARIIVFRKQCCGLTTVVVICVLYIACTELHFFCKLAATRCGTGCWTQILMRCQLPLLT